MTGPGTPVLAAPLFDPGAARIEMQLPTGLTVAQMVAAALPELPAEALERVRVALVSDRASEVVLPRYWARVRPRPGIRVIIRVLPGKGALRSVLMIVVSVAAIAMGQVWGPMLATSLGVSSQIGTALVTFGINVVGSLLVNALIPPVKPEEDKRSERYTISGWRNRYEPDGAVPVVLGTHRYAPPFAATSWTEIVGDWQYVRAIFTFGYGPLELTDFRLGETAIGEYDEVEIEVRDGREGDGPITLYPRQVIEEAVGTELTRPQPRDDAGNIISGPAIETPVVRTTAEDTAEASIILHWPGGLIYVNKDGDKESAGVTVRIEQRLVTATEWQLVETLEIRARKTEAFFRQHSWAFPSRGRWQVRLTMLTEETTSMRVQRRTVWVGLQSIRPEYPLNLREPQALVGLRIKATHQLSGQLDDFSALARLVCLDFDAPSGTWIERVTSNPASLYRQVLQSPANPRPVPDAGIDLPLIEDWHAFCVAQGLKYDRVLDDASMTLRDALTEVAAAGRATPRHDGLRWGVTIDRPQELVVDHVSPRNSWGFRATRSYTRHPDGFRVRFNDAGADYKAAERLVPWPGHTGDIVLTEALDLPGKTDAAEIWREARRRMHEAELRPDLFEVMQDGPVRVATRGDLIALSQDVLEDVQRAARVKAVRGGAILLDEAVTIEPGVSYSIRFRIGLSEADTIGSSVIRGVTALPGETSLLTLTGSGATPAEGDLVLFGRTGRESHAAIVTAVEMGEDMACLIRAVPAAPEIDARLAADPPPAWSSRVGVELPASALQPPQPRFAGVRSGASETGERGIVEIDLVPGSGPVRTARYALHHRAVGTTEWSTVYFPAAAGGHVLSTYTTGTSLELQAAGLSSSGIIGAWTPVLTIVVGGGDAALPRPLPSGATVVPVPGGARVLFETGDDVAITSVQLYRSRSAALDRAVDAVGEPHPVEASRPYEFEVGNMTRVNLLADADFGSGSPWLVSGGWSISGGAATHSPGAPGDVRQLAAIAAGKWCRIGFRIPAASAGSVTPLLTGPTERVGTSRASAGTFLDRIQAVSGQDGVSWRADSAFTGSVDDVVAYVESATCLAQGVHYFWLEPLNADGIPGPVSGPFVATIV